MFMTIIIALTAVYLTIFSFIVTGHNTRSNVVFRAVPLILGVILGVHALKLSGVAL